MSVNSLDCFDNPKMSGASSVTLVKQVCHFLWDIQLLFGSVDPLVFAKDSGLSSSSKGEEVSACLPDFFQARQGVCDDVLFSRNVLLLISSSKTGGRKSKNATAS